MKQFTCLLSTTLLALTVQGPLALFSQQSQTTAQAAAREKSDKFAVFVAGLDDAAPVAQSLIRKLNASEPFEAVTTKDPSKVAVLISCMARGKPTDPFGCMYVAEYNGAAFKTFMGGGLFFAASADAVASNFLASIAQDIVERYDRTNIDNLRGGTRKLPSYD